MMTDESQSIERSLAESASVPSPCPKTDASELSPENRTASPPTPQEGAAPAAPAPEERRPRLIVRYGALTTVGEFTYSPNLRFTDGAMLVLQTDRGIEIGQHVPLTPPSSWRNAISQQAIRDYVERSGPEYLQPRCGRVLRVATDQDLAEQNRINEDAAEELAFCQRLVKQHNLPMKLITCEHLFGGERVIFYFMAEGRVDFRDLVRDLARQYQTRIEMRQVGARDEARLAADYEICGRECCCKNFLRTLRPVSMKMAKMQKATLDPTKVSGRCGRLRCCLRYEHECYEELNRRLPKNNAWVRTPEGEGRVVDRHILAQLVSVQLDEQRQLTFPIEEIELLPDKPLQRSVGRNAGNIGEKARSPNGISSRPDRTGYDGPGPNDVSRPGRPFLPSERQPDESAREEGHSLPEGESSEDAHEESVAADETGVTQVQTGAPPIGETVNDEPDTPTNPADPAQQGRRSRSRRRRRRSRRGVNGNAGGQPSQGAR